jgi:hypothetical protein
MSVARSGLAALLALSLLQGCASDATLADLHTAQRECAGGNAAQCLNVDGLESKATHERTATAASAIILPIALVALVALAVVAGGPPMGPPPMGPRPPPPPPPPFRR